MDEAIAFKRRIHAFKRRQRMDELEMEWQELYDSGETTEDFWDWYTGRVSDAYDRYKD